MSAELTEVILHQGNPTPGEGFPQLKTQAAPELGSQGSSHHHGFTP